MSGEMEELRVGSVVYLRGDVGLESPLTVVMIAPTPSDELGVEVVWLNMDKDFRDARLPRRAVMTEGESYAVALEREMEKRGLREGSYYTRTFSKTGDRNNP